jgi:hypothetical protein
MSFRSKFKDQRGGGPGAHQSRTRSAISAAAFAALLSQAPTSARATPVVYDFDSGTQLTFDNGDVEALQGSLTLDYTALTYGLDVTLTGDSPEAGNYTGFGSLSGFQTFFMASYKSNIVSNIRLTVFLNPGPGTIPPATSISSLDANEGICTDPRPTGLNGAG